jgi:hypothetical protein
MDLFYGEKAHLRALHFACVYVSDNDQLPLTKATYITEKYD